MNFESGDGDQGQVDKSALGDKRSCFFVYIFRVGNARIAPSAGGVICLCNQMIIGVFPA